MKNVLMYWYRGGSTLLQSLLFEKGPCPELSLLKHTVLNRKIFSSTVTKDFANPVKENYIQRLHIGDHPCKNEFLKNFLPYKEKVKVAMLTRDPRNQIESYRKLYPDNDSYHERNTLRSFRFYCQGFNHRAELICSLKKHLKNHFIQIKLEHLLEQPQETVLSLYKFYDIECDCESLQNNIKLCIKPLTEQLNHSSFGQVKGHNERWHSWTNIEKETFNNMSGKYLAAIGY